MKKSITIYDIAEMADVSKSTVSRVLNNGKVSKDKRDRVLEAIKETKFKPNKNARALLKKQRQSVLIVLTRLDSYAENRIVRGMFEKSQDEIDFIIVESQFDIERTKHLVDKHNNVDYIVIFAISGENYDFVKPCKTKTVMVGQKVKGFTSFYFDDVKATTLVFNELVDENTKKIMYLGLPDSDLTSGKKRNDTIKQLCKSNNILLDFIHVEYSIETKYNIPTLSNIISYDAILCATDTIALSVYLQTMGSIKIGSIGHNRSINVFLKNFKTIGFGYKTTGEEIMLQLLENKLTSTLISPKIITSNIKGNI